MRGLRALFIALLGTFAVTAGAHAESFGAEPYQPDELTVPVENFVGWTAHADTSTSGAALRSAPRGGALSLGAKAGAAAAVCVCAYGVAAALGLEPGLLLEHVSTDTLGALLAVPPAALTKLRKTRGEKIDEARAILDKAEKEERALTDEEQTQWDGLVEEADQLQEQITRHERQAELDADLEKRSELRTVEGGEQDPDAAPESRSRAAGDRAPETRAGRDRERELRFANDSLQLLRGIAIGNGDMVREAQRSLATDGHYGEDVRKQFEARAAGDYYSTLVDADGAILLPTEVAEGIDRIGERVGVVRALCSTFTHIAGQIRVPGASGTITASAIAEGGAFTASIRALKAVTLNPKKWGAIVPWTYEANLEAGPRILEDAQWGIAQAFERARDNAVVNGDGTSAFNSIDGVLSANRSNVAVYTLASGSTSMDDLTADDVFLMRRKIPAALRSMAAYLFHPDMEPKLRTLKDGNGQYLYAYNGDTEVATLGGRPVHLTEVLPAIDDDAVSLKFGIYGYWPMFKIAIGEGMTSEQLREATITDADTGADINLATQDLRALKVREFFDADCNFEEAFCAIRTAAS